MLHVVLWASERVVRGSQGWPMLLVKVCDQLRSRLELGVAFGNLRGRAVVSLIERILIQMVFGPLGKRTLCVLRGKGAEHAWLDALGLIWVVTLVYMLEERIYGRVQRHSIDKLAHHFDLCRGLLERDGT